MTDRDQHPVDAEVDAAIDANEARVPRTPVADSLAAARTARDRHVRRRRTRVRVATLGAAAAVLLVVIGAAFALNPRGEPEREVATVGPSVSTTATATTEVAESNPGDVRGGTGDIEVDATSTAPPSTPAPTLPPPTPSTLPAPSTPGVAPDPGVIDAVPPVSTPSVPTTTPPPTLQRPMLPGEQACPGTIPDAPWNAGFDRTSPLLDFAPTRIVICTFALTPEDLGGRPTAVRVVTDGATIAGMRDDLNALAEVPDDVVCTLEKSTDYAIVVSAGARTEAIWVQGYGCGFVFNGDRMRMGGRNLTWLRMA